MLYKIKITESQSKNSYVIEIGTDRLEWSMKQYQRNRPPLTWEILEKK